jgi:uncharacterized membrane protein
MNTQILIMIFGVSFMGLLVFGSHLYRAHSIGPMVWKRLHHPELSDEDFYYAFGIHWILAIVCAIAAAVSALIYIVRFVQL